MHVRVERDTHTRAHARAHACSSIAFMCQSDPLGLILIHAHFGSQNYALLLSTEVLAQVSFFYYTL